MKTQKSLRNFHSAKERKEFIQSDLKIKLPSLSLFSFTEDQVLGKNIENLVGAIQIPLGIAGPLTINHKPNILRHHYLPIATTEGALVASISRGAKAISESGGANFQIDDVGVTRAPVFKVKNISHAVSIQTWLSQNYQKVKEICEKTSSHLKLKKVDSNFSGKNLFLRFHFDSDQAMGMNMATIAVESVVSFIEKETNSICISLSGNYDVDKKPSWLNFITGRGKRVWAEALIKRSVVKSVLKTTPEKIVDLVSRKILTGSVMSGSIGFNAHFANVIAAIFAATGQDLGQITEGSLGITSAELDENKNLYISVYLPSLMVGLVGGGTNLPAQKEALSITGAKSVIEFSGIVACAVLAGELSLLASQSEGTLAKAHIKLGRKDNNVKG